MVHACGNGMCGASGARVDRVRRAGDAARRCVSRGFVVLSFAVAVVCGFAVAPQEAWGLTANNPGIDGATDLNHGELDGAIVRFVPTGWDYELDFHNDGSTNGCDLYTYYLGTSSKMELHWDASRQAYYIEFYIRFDESEKRGKVWDVSGQSTSDGAQVHAWSPGWSNDSMYWKFFQNEDGTYYIKNKNGDTYLSLTDVTANASGVRAVISTSPKTTFDMEVIYDPDGGAYQYSTYVDALDWMSCIADNVKLSTLSIPGTHDSGTNGSNEIYSQANLYECQKYFIDEQLTVGVRAFDIRLDGDDIGSDKDNPDPRVVHTKGMKNRDGSDMRLSDVMACMKEFLAEHPSETVIFMVKRNEGSDENIMKAMEKYIGEKDSIIWTGEGVPTMGEARGKLVTFRRYALGSDAKYDTDAASDTGKWSYGFDVSNWDDQDYSIASLPQVVWQWWYDDYSKAIVYAQDYYQATSSQKVEWVEGVWDDMASDSPHGSYNSLDNLGVWHDSYVFNYTSSAQGEPFTAPMDHARNINLPLIQDGYADNSGEATWRGITMMDYIDGSWARSVFLSNFDGGVLPDGVFPSTVTTTYGDDLDGVEFSDDGVMESGQYFKLSDSAMNHAGYYTVAESGTRVSVDLCDADGTIVMTGTSELVVNPRVASLCQKDVSVEYGNLTREEEQDPGVFYELSDGAVCSDGATVPDVVVSISEDPYDGGLYRSAGVYTVNVRFDTESDVNENYRFLSHVDSTATGVYEVSKRVLEFDWSGCRDEYEYTGQLQELDKPEVVNLVDSNGDGTLDDYSFYINPDYGSNAGSYETQVYSDTGDGYIQRNYTREGSSTTRFAYRIVPRHIDSVSVWAGEYSFSNPTMTYGQLLGDIEGTLYASGMDKGDPSTGNDDKTISGTFAFDDPGKMPDATNGEYVAFSGTFMPDNKNYEVTKCNALVRVDKRPVTVRVNDVTTVYGDPKPAFTAVEVPLTVSNSGLVEGDTIDDLGLSYSVTGGALDDVTAADGSTYNKTPMGAYDVGATASSGNYEVTVRRGVWNVQQRTVELAWEGVTDRYLNDDKGNPTASVTNALPDDVVTVAVSTPTEVAKPAGAAEGVGLYSVMATSLNGASSSNYVLSSDARQTMRYYYVRKAEADCVFPTQAAVVYGATIGEAELEGGSGDGSFAFDASKSLAVTKIADADGAAVSESVPSATLNSVLDAGTYKVTGTVTFNPREPQSTQSPSQETTITLVVSKRPVTATVQHKEKEYGVSMPTFEVGVPNGSLAQDDDVASLKCQFSVTDLSGSVAPSDFEADGKVYNDASVGSYEVSATSGNENYSVTFIPGTLSIYPRTLVFKWDGMTQPDGSPLVYDGTAKNVTAQPTNLVPREDGAVADVSVTVVGGDAVNAGTHYAFATGLSGTDAGNYRLPPVGTVGSSTSRVQEYEIDKATPKVEWPAGSLTYGQTLAEAALSGGTATGVTVGGSSEPEVVMGTFSFAKDVADTMPKVTDPDTAYPMTFTSLNPNYESVKSASGDGAKVTVSPKPVTVRINMLRSMFGDDLPDPQFTVLGGTDSGGCPNVLVGNDTEDDLDVNLSIEGAETSFEYEGVTYNRTPVGSYSIKGESDSSNYDVRFVGFAPSADGSGIELGETGALVVVPRPVSLTWQGTLQDDGSPLVYDGAAKNVTAEAGNLVPLSDAGGFDEVRVVVEGGTELHAGSYTATATGLRTGLFDLWDETNYCLPEGDASSVSYDIAKATPQVTWPDDGTMTAGQTLSQAAFTVEGAAFGVGGGSVPGDFAFVFSDRIIESEGDAAYLMRFTPAVIDGFEDYASVVAWVPVTVKPASDPDPGVPSDPDGGSDAPSDSDDGTDDGSNDGGSGNNSGSGSDGEGASAAEGSSGDSSTPDTSDPNVLPIVIPIAVAIIAGIVVSIASNRRK